MSGTGFINSPGSGATQITTLANADHYNLIDAYVVPTASGGGSSYYGSVPTFSYELATTAAGGTAFNDGDPSGTATFSGAPTNASGVGNYTVGYTGGLSFANERYAINTGNDLAWSVVARPLTVTVNKVYDGTAAFSSGFALSNIVNGDATPTLTGGASVSSGNAATYNSFASSTLSQNNANYTLTGATINATISPRPLDVTVSKTYDGSTIFNRGFSFAGMIGSEAMPTVSGSASTPGMTAGTYTQFASNNLVLSDANYTVDGGTVSATITPQPPVIPVTVPPVAPTPTSVPTTPELSLPGDTGPLTTTQPLTQGAQPLQDTSSPLQTTSNAQLAAPQDVSASSSAPTSSSSAASTVADAMSDNSGSVTYSGNDGLVVSLVREPSSQASGVISVMVPQDMSAGGGFSFPLPEQIVAKADASSLSMRTADGGALPGWLKFNPETKSFTATSVPAGGLPIYIVVSIDGVETTIAISEKP
jgi:hypothetical protein